MSDFLKDLEEIDAVSVPAVKIEEGKIAVLDVFRKITRKEISEDMKDSLLEKFSATEAVVIAKAWNEVFADLEESLQSVAINKTAGKVTEVFIGGRVVATIEERSLPAKWDYKGDVELAKMEEDAKILKVKIDERKKLLQVIKTEVVDPVTGVASSPAEKISQGVTIAIKLK